MILEVGSGLVISIIKLKMLSFYLKLVDIKTKQTPNTTENLNLESKYYGKYQIKQSILMLKTFITTSCFYFLA